jgi:serine/threonine protein kinase
VAKTSPEWWIKIGDFGTSKRVSKNNTIKHTTTGTSAYLASELGGYVSGVNDESGAYTNTVYIGSFGGVIYEIIALWVPILFLSRGF